MKNHLMIDDLKKITAGLDSPARLKNKAYHSCVNKEEGHCKHKPANLGTVSADVVPDKKEEN